MSQAAPEPTPTQGDPAPTPTAPPTPTEPDAGKGGKDAILADLAKERDKRQALEQQFADLTKQQEQQREAFAKALGIKPDETSDTDKLTGRLNLLQEQFAAQQLKATRLEVAASNGIPAEFQGWLTAATPEDLDAQAKQLLPMVQATLAARGQSPLLPGQPAPATPAFQPIPGQGQTGALTPQQQSAAGYGEFYDEHGRPRS